MSDATLLAAYSTALKTIRFDGKQGRSVDSLTVNGGELTIAVSNRSARTTLTLPAGIPELRKITDASNWALYLAREVGL